jgi:RNase adaptor protein for sRNA GlmZ degradation
MVEQPAFQMPALEPGKLTVTLTSFSYRKGIPEDFTGNGGGFVFDCRALPNPGRFDEYRTKTGKDKEVIQFLKDKPEVNEFIDQVTKVVTLSVGEYTNRKFEHLMVSFGCTGGQHRSVYCADRVAAYLKHRFNINVRLKHQELEKTENVNKLL